MPELPEVETTRRGLQPWLEGHIIRQVSVHNNALRWPVPEELGHIRERSVGRILRRGKYLLLETEAETIIVHLGMSGSLRVVDPDEPLKVHDHICLDLDHGRQIRFNDPRRFGCFLLSTNWPNHPLLKHLGPEPLGDTFDTDYFLFALKQRRGAIKQALMDSQLVVGVGNIYANEALFLAGIDPRRPANRISRLRVDRLRRCIREVLQAAIEQGGTTLRDFVNSDGKPGYFKQRLFVYGNAGRPCKVCSTLLREVRLHNRSTVLCPNCQH